MIACTPENQRQILKPDFKSSRIILENEIPHGLVLIDSGSVPKSKLTLENYWAIIRVERKSTLFLRKFILLHCAAGCVVPKGYAGTLISVVGAQHALVQAMSTKWEPPCYQLAYQRIQLISVPVCNRMKSTVTNSMQDTFRILHDVMFASYSLSSTKCNVDSTHMDLTSDSAAKNCGQPNA